MIGTNILYLDNKTNIPHLDKYKDENSMTT